MKQIRASLSARVFLSACLVATGIATVVACSDDETSTATTDAGLEGSTATLPDTGTGTTSDGGTEETTDGGGVPLVDDGGTDIDGGFDAGPACQTLTMGPYDKSLCTTRAVRPAGGDLTTTTYTLLRVIVFGSTTFCAPGGGYVDFDHRGALRVTATSATEANFELIDQYRTTNTGGPPTRPTTLRYDVKATAAGATLTFTTLTCAPKPPPEKATFTVGAVAGKKTISLRLPYGAGTAYYEFIEP